MFKQAQRQRGFSLIEMMVALVLGLLVTAAVLAMYASTSRNFAHDERYAFMQENGRYALKALVEDLSMADFWGKLVSTDTVSTALAPPGGNCGVGIALYDATTSLQFNNYHLSPPLTQFAPCAAITGVQRAGTDMLAIKRVRGDSTAATFVDTADTDGDGDTAETLSTGASDLSNGTVYLRTNGTAGSLINDASSGNPPALGESDWEYIPRLYFIRNFYETAGDGVPALCRMDVNGTGLAAAECMAEGIEDMHLQFGIDTDVDGVANQYIANPTVAQMVNAVTARLYVLVRSSDPDGHYTNTKSYVLGDAVIAAANDNFYRRVYSTTITLRNVVNRSLIN